MARRREVKILQVQAVGEYRLEVKWSGEPLKVRMPILELVDLRSKLLSKYGLEGLRDPELFSRVKLAEGGLELVWPNGKVVTAADLNRWSLRQHARSDTADFRDWLGRHRLTLEQAAEALGISRRRVASYASGEKPVPRVITLACAGHQHITMMATKGWNPLFA